MISEGIILTVVSIIVGLGVTVYFSEIGTFRPRGDPRFKHIIGQFNLWNYSREFKGTLVCAETIIFRRFLKTPGVRLVYHSRDEEWVLEGSVFVSGDRFYMLLDYKNISADDPTLIVFEPPQAVWINIGFMAGYEIPQRPCAGVALLCHKSVTEKDVISILGSEQDDDVVVRLDYSIFAGQRHALRELRRSESASSSRTAM